MKFLLLILPLVYLPWTSADCDHALADADSLIEYQQTRDKVRTVENKISRMMSKMGHTLSAAEMRREHLVSIMRFHILHGDWKKALGIARDSIFRVQEAANFVRKARLHLTALEEGRNLESVQNDFTQSLQREKQIEDLKSTIQKYEKQMSDFNECRSFLRFLNYLIRNGQQAGANAQQTAMAKTANMVLDNLQKDFSSRHAGQEPYQFMNIEELEEAFHNSRTMTPLLAMNKRDLWMQRWSLYWLRVKSALGLQITQKLLGKTIELMPPTIQASLPDILIYLRDSDAARFDIPQVKNLMLQPQSTLEEKVEQLRDFEKTTLTSFARMNQKEVEDLWNDLKREALVVIAKRAKSDKKLAEELGLEKTQSKNVEKLAKMDLDELQRKVTGFYPLRDHKLYEYVALLKDMKSAEEKARKMGPISEYFPRAQVQLEASLGVLTLLTASYVYDRYGDQNDWMWSMNHWLVENATTLAGAPMQALQAILPGLGN